MKYSFISFSIMAMLIWQACSNGNASSSKERGSENNPTRSGTIHLTRDEFITKVIDYTKGVENMKYLGDKPCIVDFYADWCAPCKIAAPIMEELAKEYEGRIYIYKINTQNERQLSMDLGIQSIPTFLFFPIDGKPFTSSGIGKSKEETKKMFRDIIERQLLQNSK